MKQTKKPVHVAYFSMEFAVDHRIPNYAGGLGVLAADYMMAMADMNFSGVGVSLIYHLHEDPKQGFDPSQFMKKHPKTITVNIEGRPVKIVLYEYTVKGSKKNVPIICLSTNHPENEPWDRDITRYLYSSQEYTRLCQEAILGIGGVRALEALGYDVSNYHMNEGHAAFLTLEVLKNNNYDENAVKKQVSFTTHTPVPAGHDHFPYDLAYKVIGDMLPLNIRDLATQESLSMTHLALNLSGTSNSVAEKHREVCQHMFPDYSFENVTNGVHPQRWATEPAVKLFNKHLRGWKSNPQKFKKALDIPLEEIKEMRLANKQRFVDWINHKPNLFVFSSPTCKDDLFDAETLTIGFARRFVPYKRANLIFRDIDKLRKLGYKKLQIVFAGPAQPDNQFAQQMVASIRHASEVLRGQVKVGVIPEYNTNISSYMISGCDAWLNNPILPREASGTSGMKASLNGGLNISIPDGWWIEGYNMDKKAGWSFGGMECYESAEERDNYDAEGLYHTLQEVIECYYQKPEEWLDRSRHAISLLSFFSAQRAIEQYNERMWKNK